MRYKIFLLPFPFDDFSAQKVRPAICLTQSIGSYHHVVVAFITSQIPKDLTNSDIIIEEGTDLFYKTGLKVTSTIRLHRLTTVPVSLIIRELGEATKNLQYQINIKLQTLFNLKL